MIAQNIKPSGAMNLTKKHYIWLGGLMIALVCIICFAAFYYREDIGHLQNYGYIGAFIGGLIAGSSIPVPLPYVVITFTLGGILIPALVGLASGLGAGIGGTLVYLFGRSGCSLASGMIPSDNNQTSNRLYGRIMNLARRRGSLAVFLMSAMFNPLFAPMAITMGALRYRFLSFLLWCSAGNIVKSMIIAYCGYFGLGIITKLIGG